MALRDNIKIETPFIIYGRNYTGQFVSRIYVTDSITSLNLADENGLFRLVPITVQTEEGEQIAYYELYLYRCALINVQACECPVINDLSLTVKGVNGEVEYCNFPIYTVIPGHVQNAATEANTFGKHRLPSAEKYTKKQGHSVHRDAGSL